QGDSNRLRGPFAGGSENRETGALHLFLDQAKRGVTLDLDNEAGRGMLTRLAANADALIASGTRETLQRRGLTYESLQAANPALIVTSITPFGLAAQRTTPA